jgi:hypothetical protein
MRPSELTVFNSGPTHVRDPSRSIEHRTLSRTRSGMTFYLGAASDTCLFTRYISANVPSAIVITT